MLLEVLIIGHPPVHDHCGSIFQTDPSFEDVEHLTDGLAVLSVSIEDLMRIRAHPEMGRKIDRELGLPGLYHVEPFPPAHRILWEEGLRDYPPEIMNMTREELIRHFPPDPSENDASDVEIIIRNLIWQLYRWKLAGRKPSYEVTTPRGFLYRSLGVVKSVWGSPGRTLIVGWNWREPS